ncbi:hypothetical protein HK099_005355 [Clydaea vesicula]|uniref:Bro-N domain-containing protein n=1 Tax=Clydaea vesicula TaxID=447962 RepID=A0AAD5TZI8_9FUNG|nr:hypothetical protein HK099_005355 [Clydaea vesicula]
MEALIHEKRIKNSVGKLDEEDKILLFAKDFFTIDKIYSDGTRTTNQKQWFVTETGLYDLLMKSTKPKAQPFRKWVFSMIKEFRQTGEYNLNKKLLEVEEKLKKNEIENQTKLKQIELESKTKIDELEKKNEKIQAELEAKTLKKYEEVEKTGCNFTLKTDSEKYYRNGMTTKELKKRIASHQTSNEETIIIEHEMKTSNADLLEKMVHYCLSEYKNSVKSSYEKISKFELISVILKKLNFNEKDIQQTRFTENISIPVELFHWCQKNIEYDENSTLKMKEFCDRRFSNGESLKKKGVFVNNFEKY